MKKILVLGACIVYLNACFCQTPAFNKEELRFVYAELMFQFSEAVSPYFQSGMSQEDFQHNLLGKSVPTETGKDLIAAAFQVLINKSDKELVLRTYVGREIRASLQVLHDLKQKDESSDGSELFGISADHPDIYAREGKCKWFQFSCLLNELATWIIILVTPQYFIYPFLI